MPEYGYWIIFGLGLIISEFLLTGLVTVFLGVAALAVGVLVYLGLLSDPVWEITLFAAISLALLLLVRRYLRDRLLGRQTRAEDSGDSAGLVGHRATVETPFNDGAGTVVYRGARWQAQSTHTLSAGQMVRIVQHDGLWLTVEPWAPASSSPSSSQN